jgi:hypothetical protein
MMAAIICCGRWPVVAALRLDEACPLASSAGRFGGSLGDRVIG